MQKVSEEHKKQVARARSARYFKRHREEIRVKRKLEYQKNQEKYSEQGKQWRKLNPDYSRTWSAKNRGYMNQKSREYRAKFPERTKATARNYQQKNRHKFATWSAGKRAKERNQSVGDTAVIFRWRKMWTAKRLAVCFWCRETKSTKDCAADHIIPIAKGGAHSIENLCISCNRCNHKKHSKMPAVWNQQITQPTLL
jgi:5-methylcytosine-specific restriction endonuclease McrA